MNSPAADTATRTLATFVAECEVPEVARSAGGATVRRSLRAAVRGGGDAVVTSAVRSCRVLGLDGDLAVPGRSERLAPYAAALVAGAAAAAGRQGDDGPAFVVATAALVCGARYGATGSDLLSAVAVGTEVAVRLGAALGPAHEAVGWDTACTLGVVGAAVASGRLAGLPADRMVHAIAYGATQAAGLRVQAGTSAGVLQAGKAAADGVEAAHVVAFGTTGPVAPLEGRRGMGALMSDGLDAGRLIGELGSTWVHVVDAGEVPEGDPGVRRGDPPGLAGLLADLEGLGSVDRLCRAAAG